MRLSQRTTQGIFWIIGSIVVTALFLFPLLSPIPYSFVIHIIVKYPYAAPAVIIVSKFITAVLAPLPGAPIAIASLAFLPWWEAMLYNLIGSELGVVAAFFIARKYRERIVGYLTPLKKIHEFQDTISHRTQFWAFLAFRLISQAAFDIVSYAAGLTKISFATFIIAVILIDIPTHIVFFYLGGIAARYSVYMTVVAGGIFFALAWWLNRRIYISRGQV
ncbi:MAG: hypothetical protein G01um101433_37 [Parcubacteria group bacterium Gr01-1014_33]|nr:MAG: hypothetical protein G01um101433_37 [Parcubacteria group bacterium Gr01-1014_33]